MDLFEQYMKNASRFLKEDWDEEDQIGPEEQSFGDESLEDDLPMDPESLDDMKGLEDEEAAEDEIPMMPCPDCDGEGVITDDDGEEVECETCGGTGEVEQEFDFDPEEGVCPCCGCKLNLIEPEADEEEVEDEEELEDEETEEAEEDEAEDEE